MNAYYNSYSLAELEKTAYLSPSIDGLQAYCRALEDEIEEADEFMAENERLEEEVNKLENAQAALETENGQLNEKILDLETELDELKASSEKETDDDAAASGEHSDDEDTPSGELSVLSKPSDPPQFAHIVPGRFLPGGREGNFLLDSDPVVGAEVWQIPTNRKGCACALIGFGGKRTKPDFYYAMKTHEDARRYADEYIGKLQGQLKRRLDDVAKKKAQRAAGHKLAIGDVLECAWGYDQTNVDYFEVTRLIGKTQVEIRAISQQSEETGFMSGKCVPLPGEFSGKPMRKTVQDSGTSVRIYAHASANKIEPRLVGGMKCWPESHWTAYA